MRGAVATVPVPQTDPNRKFDHDAVVHESRRLAMRHEAAVDLA